MEQDKVRLSNEHEPYLMTFYGKVLDARAEHSILGDTFADQAARRIDFDFAKLKLPEGAAITLPMRAKHLDGWVREFLAAHPESTVLHLGCGLDSRVFRIDPPPTVRWYDVDLPDVIALRRRLYPERPSYELISASVIELEWLDRVPSDRPVLVVAEGLVTYLPETEGIALFNRITQTFPSGELIFDAYSLLTTRLIMLGARVAMLGARLPLNLSWAIDDPRRLEAQVPGLTLSDVVPFLTMPDLVTRLSRTRTQRTMYRMMDRVGFLGAFFRKSIMHVRYRF